MKLISSLSAALLLSSPALADVLIVGSSSGDYVDLYQAHGAASAGDTIYFRPGIHTIPSTWFNITKPLHLVGSGANNCVLAFRLVLSGSSIGSGDVSLSGLKIEGPPDTNGALLVSCCEGRVHLQDLHIQPAGFHRLGTSLSYGTYFDECEEIVATNCVLEGRAGESTTDEGADGGHGLYVNESQVVLYGTRVLGGQGGEQGQTHYAADGPGDGGNALTIYGTVVKHAGSAFVGGQPGFDFWAPGSPGHDTASYGGGGHLAMTHARFFFDLPGLAEEGTSVELRAFGPVGTNVFALTSSLGHFRDLGPNFGILHLGGVLDVTLLGQIPAGGQLSVPYAAPLLGGAPAALQRIQLFASGAGQRMISDPRIRTIVPPGI